MANNVPKVHLNRQDFFMASYTFLASFCEGVIQSH